VFAEKIKLCGLPDLPFSSVFLRVLCGKWFGFLQISVIRVDQWYGFLFFRRLLPPRDPLHLKPGVEQQPARSQKSPRGKVPFEVRPVHHVELLKQRDV
jgi:hypothetical protein